MAKLKKEFIGQKTYSKALNKMVLIEEGVANILMNEGRFDLFQFEPKKILKPKAKKAEKVEEKEEETKEEK